MDMLWACNRAGPHYPTVQEIVSTSHRSGTSPAQIQLLTQLPGFSWEMLTPKTRALAPKPQKDPARVSTGPLPAGLGSGCSHAKRGRGKCNQRVTLLPASPDQPRPQCPRFPGGPPEERASPSPREHYWACGQNLLARRRGQHTIQSEMRLVK